MARLLFLATLSCCLFTVTTGAQQPAPTRIDGRPSCSGCTIRLDSVASLGSDSEPVVISGPAGLAVVRPARDGQGRYFTAVSNGAQVAVYDSTGRLQGVLNAATEDTPAGFRAVSALAVGPGDSLFIASGARVHVLAPDFALARSFDLLRYNSLVAVLGNGTVISAVPLSANEKSMPVTRYNPAGLAPVGFGAADSLPRGECVSCEQREVLATRDRSAVWVSLRNEYRATRYDANGRATAALVVESSPWYEGWTTQADNPNPLLAKPRSVITGISADANNQLWVMATAAPEGWEPFSGTRSEGVLVVGSRAVIRPEMLTAEERSYLMGNTATVIEVVDMSTRRVVASRIMNGAKYYPLDGDLIYTVTQTPGGGNRIDIFRMTLVRPAS